MTVLKYDQAVRLNGADFRRKTGVDPETFAEIEAVLHDREANKGKSGPVSLRHSATVSPPKPDFRRRSTGKWLDFGNLPDDSQVWQRLRLGDTMALFQIESPAQTIMTARLRPENMTDLAHQIALVRPGPIQSGTVHPYVRRRLGEEPVPTLREPLQSILRPSLNVLLFQEQILRLTVRYAGMDWVAADRFRKDVSSVEEAGEMEHLRRRFLDGAAFTCQAPEEEAAEVFGWCAAFRGYGFAESHAWAFAQHSYTSAYLRHHFPAPYLAAFLTESPGMWPAHTIVLEAKRWGVQLLPLSLNRSEVTYRAESTTQVRIALTAVDGISETCRAPDRAGAAPWRPLQEH